MRHLLFAGAILTLASAASRCSAEPLNLNQPSVEQAQRQLDDVAKESQDNSRYWTEKHQKDETNQKLNDIEDAIILNGLENNDE